MKSILYLTLILLITGLTAMGQNVQQLIDDVRKSLAPDKRTAIFDINFRLENEAVILFGEVSDELFKQKLIETIEKDLKIKVIDSIETLPSKKLGNRIYGIVNLSVCNIRSKPDHAAELSTQALMGTPVKVYKEQAGWYLIQTPDDYLGWVDDDGIALKNSTEMKNWINQEKIIFTNIYGFIYKDESFNEIVSDVVAGNLIEKISASKNSFKVRLPDNRVGFIKLTEAEDFKVWFEKLTFSADSVLAFAKKMMGFPYLWGGTSSKGVDCSGFMKTIFFMNGLILPRDANQQALVGKEIEFDTEFSKLQSGDLIFFGRKGNEVRPERITHVGIYIGNKKFLHSSGRVRLDSFDKDDINYNEYRLNTIVRIKRILGDRETIEKLKITNNKFYTLEFYK